MLTTRSVVSIFLGVMAVVGAEAVFSQDFPTKPIRIYTGGIGTSNDLAARLIAQGITGPLGQPVIVENRGSAVLSTQAVAQSPPDGHSLVVGGDLIWLNPLLRGLPDAMVNFAPVSMLASAPNVLTVHPSLPVKSVKELIALAKARPGDLNVAVSTPGGIDHLATELFMSMTGTKLVIIHYKGGAARAAALAGGETQLSFGTLAGSTPHIKSGRVRALAVTSSQPSTLAGGLPTIAASGLPGFDLAGQDAIYTTAKTPAAVVNRLSQEIVRFLKTKDAQEKYLSFGAEVVASTPEEHVAYLKSRVAVIGKLIKDASIRIE